MNDTLSLQAINLTDQVTIEDIVPEFSGNYSSVHRGSLNGSPVAVKIIKSTGKDDTVQRKLRREMAVWCTTKHPNIYPFLGYAQDKAFGAFGALISPWCGNGDASRFLSENGENMPMTERANLWQGVVDGVIYLHEHKPPIVHGDLKPGNILIDEDGQPRICDFGLSRVFLEESDNGMTTTSEHTGTARYLAPELVASDTSVPPTFPSDVYALGSIGLEIVFLQKPYSKHTNNLRGQIFRDLRKGLKPADTPPRQEWPSQRIWPLLTECWNPLPPCRPTAWSLGYLLKRKVSPLPDSVVERIVSLAAKQYEKSVRYASHRWDEYCRLLRDLCLVSKACCRTITPMLYANIRLRLDNDPSILFTLLNTLIASKVESLNGADLSHYPGGGYASYTRSLVLRIKRGFTSPSFQSGIKTVIQMLPHLRQVLIHNETNNLWIMNPSELRTLMLIGGLNGRLVLDQIPAILAMKHLQRLHLRSLSPIHSRGLVVAYNPIQNLGLSKEFLPNLREIDVAEAGAEATSELLALLAHWKIPRIKSFNFCGHDEEGFTISLYQFLRAHGHLLWHLTLVDPLGKVKVADVLYHCRNLRFFDYRCGSLATMEVSNPHWRLEGFIARVYAVPNAQPVQCALFKKLLFSTRDFLPNLMEASLRNEFGTRELASYLANDDFITVYEKESTQRIYEDGRTSPPPSDPLGGKVSVAL